MFIRIITDNFCGGLLRLWSLLGTQQGEKNLHLMLDIKFPAENLFQLDLVFKGLTRLKNHMPNRALPMTPQILKEMYALLDMSKSEDITYWCLYFL